MQEEPCVGWVLFQAVPRAAVEVSQRLYEVHRIIAASCVNIQNEILLDTAPSFQNNIYLPQAVYGRYRWHGSSQF